MRREAVGTAAASKSVMKQKPAGATIRGWKKIADYLQHPMSTAQRWAKEGMPVRREGRNVVAEPEQLNAWLARESHAPDAVTIANSNQDLMADLRRGLTAVRKHKRHRAA